MKQYQRPLNILSGINFPESQKGASLAFVIIVVMIFTIFVATLATRVNTNSRMNVLTGSEVRAMYLVESGMEYAIRNSVTNSNFSWTDTVNYNGGSFEVNVTLPATDTAIVEVVGRFNQTAKKSTYILNITDLTGYTMYTQGDIYTRPFSGVWTDDIDRIQRNTSGVPDLDLDSLRSVAQSQGNFYSGNTQVNGTFVFPSNSFWSDPGDHDKDATVVYVEGNLKIKSSLCVLNGIFVIEGDLKYDNFGLQQINGVVYFPTESNRSVFRVGVLTILDLYGGVVGNFDLNTQPFSLVGLIYNSTFLEKFYSYSLNDDFFQIAPVSWIVDY